MQQTDNRGFFSFFTQGTQFFLAHIKEMSFYLLLVIWLVANALIRFFQGQAALNISSDLRSRVLDPFSAIDLLRLYTSDLYQLLGLFVLNYVAVFFVLFFCVYSLCKTFFSKTIARSIQLNIRTVFSAFLISSFFVFCASITSFLVLPMVLFFSAAAVSLYLTLRYYPAKGFLWVLKNSFSLKFIYSKRRKYFINMIDLMGLTLFCIIFIDMIFMRVPWLMSFWQSSPSDEYLNLSKFSPSWHATCLWLVQSSLLFAVLNHYLCCVFSFSKKR